MLAVYRPSPGVDAMQGAICGWSPYNYYVRMLSPAYVVPARLHGYGQLAKSFEPA